jgi:hypothetical protein
MYLQYQLMKTLQKERLRAAARDHLAAEARRARTAGRDHAAATRAGATARDAATMARKQGAIIGLGIPLGAILLFPQGIIPAVLKLAHARGRIWFLPLYLPKPLQWPACFVMIILGVAVYCYVLWTMRQLKKSSRELHAGKVGGRSPKSALTRIGTGQNLGAAPRGRLCGARAERSDQHLRECRPQIHPGRADRVLFAVAVKWLPGFSLKSASTVCLPWWRPVSWWRVREWLVRRAGLRGVSRPRWSQSRSPGALPGPQPAVRWRRAGRRPGGGRRRRR